MTTKEVDHTVTELEEFGRRMNEKVYKRCKESEWEKGFKIFYTKLVHKPSMMILSLNPGGGKKDFEGDQIRFKKGCFEVGKVNEYDEESYPFARAIQGLFKNQKKILKNMVGIPILFFRSKGEDDWKKESIKKYGKDGSLNHELFCYTNTMEIIKRVEPKSIFIVGISTFETLLRERLLLPILIKDIKRGNNNQRIYLEMEWKNIPIFCVRHLTGSRMSNKDRDQMKNEFDRFCEKYSLN